VGCENENILTSRNVLRRDQDKWCAELSYLSAMPSPIRAPSLHLSEVKSRFVLVLGMCVPGRRDRRGPHLSTSYFAGAISSAKLRSAAARANAKPVDKRLPFWNQCHLAHCEHFRSRGSTLSGTVPRCLQLGQMIAISMDLLNSAIMSGGQDGGSCFPQAASFH
jgi:hypothetical protein